MLAAKNRVLLTLACVSLIIAVNAGTEKTPNQLPLVFPPGHPDLTSDRLMREAAMRYTMHRLPDTKEKWEQYKPELRKMIVAKTGMVWKQQLALDMHETGSFQDKGYTVKKVIYQTLPGVYATANLYVPEGQGPFPGVVVMCGHTRSGKLGYQYLGYTLAESGFVAMVVDPWGAGERGTVHGEFEYHGGVLAASLWNLGRSLMGMQITDNMRAVELLQSLPYVDPNCIGATGASGGGNQTMWLAAMDERVKVAVPVVSVGTFESYIMSRNCVCEVLVDGLTFTEESAILGLVAPRTMMISNGLKDSNKAFYPAEMLRSHHNALRIFDFYNATNNLTHLIFDGPHSYPPESVSAMLKLFGKCLKGDKALSELPPRDRYPDEQLMVFAKGQRDPKVVSTAEFCRWEGARLRQNFLEQTVINRQEKCATLRDVLRIREFPQILDCNSLADASGWERVSLELSDGKLLPLRLFKSPQQSAEYVIMVHPEGSDQIPATELDTVIRTGVNVVVPDLSCTGETVAQMSVRGDRTRRLLTPGRAYIWLGKTVMGEWVCELDAIASYLRQKHQATSIRINGSREAGLAALYYSALGKRIAEVKLHELPLGYLFDQPEGLESISLGVHVPGIMQWGDISLVAALSSAQVIIANPITMSGKPVTGSRLTEYQQEYAALAQACNQKKSIVWE